MKLKDPALLREQCFVGGKWIGKAETDVTDPATGAVIARVPKFAGAETRDAIAEADAAFRLLGETDRQGAGEGSPRAGSS